MLITLILTYIVTFVLSFIFLVWNDCNFITNTSPIFLASLKRFWKLSLRTVDLIASAIFALVITFAVFTFVFAFPDTIRSHDIRNQLIEAHRNNKCPECRWMDMGMIQYDPTTNKFIKSGFETYKWVSCNKLEKELEEQLNK